MDSHADTGAIATSLQLFKRQIIYNIFVGIYNKNPLPPFDGRNVAVATYERIRSRKGKRYHADITKLMPVAYAMVMVLVFIAVSSVYLDIVRPAANPFQ